MADSRRLLRQILLTFAKWVDQNLNQRNQRGHHSKLAALGSFKEWRYAREKGRVFLDVIDQRPRV